MMQPGTLHQQVEEFGQETAELLCATLPGLPDPPVRILRYEDRFVISPPDSKTLPLYISGEHLADMKVSIACQLDSVGHYLAVEESKFDLLAVLDRTRSCGSITGVRRAADRQPTCTSTGTAARCPTCCPRAGHGTPHDVSSLHVPLGGSRFRPCLEDFIQFLICECGFDPYDGWLARSAAGHQEHSAPHLVATRAQGLARWL
jgi:hypothetical protein